MTYIFTPIGGQREKLAGDLTIEDKWTDAFLHKTEPVALTSPADATSREQNERAPTSTFGLYLFLSLLIGTFAEFSAKRTELVKKIKKKALTGSAQGSTNFVTTDRWRPISVSLDSSVSEIIPLCFLVCFIFFYFYWFNISMPL